MFSRPRNLFFASTIYQEQKRNNRNCEENNLQRKNNAKLIQYIKCNFTKLIIIINITIQLLSCHKQYCFVALFEILPT